MLCTAPAALLHPADPAVLHATDAALLCAAAAITAGSLLRQRQSQ